MPFKMETSDRPSGKVFIENTLLFICVVSLIPVALSVVGIIFIAPLVMGLRRSLRYSNGDSIRGTSKPIQLMLIAFIIIPSYNIYIENNESQKLKYELYDYNRNFPHKKELEVHKSMAMSDLIMRYGADEADTINSIYVQHYSTNRNYAAAWGAHDREIERQEIWFSIIFFYLFILTFGWVEPLSRKIDAGELTFVSRKYRDRRGKIITGSEGMRGFSVADELIKWNELREKGLISNLEFETARRRLMSGSSG